METLKVTAPAYAASYLLNGDDSGMTATEKSQIDAYLKGLAIIDVARDENGEAMEPRFTWAFALHGGSAEGGDVLDYVAVATA